MRVTIPLLLCLLAASAAGGVTLSFEEEPAANANAPAIGDDYAHHGVHFRTADGVVWDGRTRGDPGGWGLEGRNGPSFLGFNGLGYDLFASFEAPVRRLRLDVASSAGARPGARFTLEGYRDGALVERETLELGHVDEWLTAGLDAEVDAMRWGEDDRFHPFGVDNLRWIPADREPTGVDVELRPGTRIPLDLRAGGVFGAILFGHDGFFVEEVDESTLAIGPDGAGISNPSSLHFRDVDEDGWLDLVALYRLEEAGIGPADPEVCLTGETFAGEPFEGCVAALVTAAAGE